MILENALRLAGILEIASPRVAVLAAIEQVNPGIPSTLDAAILAKMGKENNSAMSWSRDPWILTAP